MNIKNVLCQQADMPAVGNNGNIVEAHSSSLQHYEIPLQNTMFSDAMQDSTQRKNAIRAGLYDVHARYVAIQTKLCYTENIRTEKDGR